MRPKQSPTGQKPHSGKTAVKAKKSPRRKAPKSDRASIASLVGALGFAVLLLTGYLVTSGTSYTVPSFSVLRTSDNAESSTKKSKGKAHEMSRVVVTVDKTHSTGQPWDGLSNPPDLALCFTANETHYCEPEADSPQTLSRAHCKDSLVCRFNKIEVPKGYFTVTVIDIDPSKNELVGTGRCKAGSACRIGDALVQIAAQRQKVVSKPKPQETLKNSHQAPPTTEKASEMTESVIAKAEEPPPEDIPPKKVESDRETMFRLLKGSPVPGKNNRQVFASVSKFKTWVKTTKINRHIEKINVYGVGSAVDSDVLIVTMKAAWESQTKAFRLRMAQKLWKQWAHIDSPEQLSRSYLWLDNKKGQRVGGSRVVNGSVIWVR